MERNGPSWIVILGGIGIVALLGFILLPRTGSDIDEIQARAEATKPAESLAQRCDSGDLEACASLSGAPVESESTDSVVKDETALLRECSAEEFESCRELAIHFKRESDPVDVQVAELRDIIARCNEGENNACALIVAYSWKPQPGIDTSSFEAKCEKGNFPACWVAARQFAVEAPQRLEGLCEEAFQPACDLLAICKGATEPRCGYLADDPETEARWSSLVGRSALEPYYDSANEVARNAALDRWIVEARTLGVLRDDLAELCAEDILACRTALILDLRMKMGSEIESPMLEYALLRYGCERGDVESCSALSRLTFSLLGVEEPNLEATFLDACNEGKEGACSSYGYEVLNRDGGVAAAAALEPLCERRKPGACGVLMEFYSAGFSGLERNEERAREIRRELCSEGAKKYCD